MELIYIGLLFIGLGTTIVAGIIITYLIIWLIREIKGE